MTSYSPWNSLSTPVSPLSMGWFFPDAVQVHITAKLTPNHNYHQIAKDFFEKYAAANNIGIEHLGNYYHPDALISINIHRGTNDNNNLHEMTGFNNFKRKIDELKMTSIKYHSMVFTTQPISVDTVLVTFSGKAEINHTNFSVVSTFIIKYSEIGSKIMNHMLDIFV